MGGAGFRAVVRLVAKGRVTLVEHARIDHGTTLVWTGDIHGEVA
ncbi:hypothetical protein QO016_001326 [Methylobacterium persicinum]|uniref:Uncharacterized protein n=1 Tax=Methylobacterium persicinum TaxID=374426 RepID=A0ABU0HHP1_9HYPH|nr:hypothetical protein [Methylobacterium persicinum]